MLRPFKDKRPIGPFFTNDDGYVLAPSENIEPPKVTDSKGNEIYWEGWTENDTVKEIPTELCGLTGVYYPNKNWVAVENRTIAHHPRFQDQASQYDTIPDLKEHLNIPFAHSYFAAYPSALGPVEMQNNPDKIKEVQRTDGWNSFISIPQEDSYLFGNDNYLSSTDVDTKALHHIAYVLFSLGIEGESTVNMEVRGEGPKFYLEEAYANLPRLGLNMVPEQRFERNNEVHKKNI